MSARPTTAAIRAAQAAISAEARAAIARTGLSHQDVRAAMEAITGQQIEQSWFSRRYSGKIPWSSEELLILCNAIDEDITKVYAAGAAALEAARKTNPCLSESASVCSKGTEGQWARRGIELGRRLFPSLTGTKGEVAGYAQVA